MQTWHVVEFNLLLSLCTHCFVVAKLQNLVICEELKQEQILPYAVFTEFVSAILNRT